MEKINQNLKEDLESKGHIYIAKDGERLDTIVYQYYGTLALFSKVLSANPNLTQKP